MTRQACFHKWFSYTLALLVVWLLDAYILSRWPVFGVTPILLPVAVTAVSVLEGVAGGAGFGLGAGLLWTIAYPGSHAVRVLLLTAMGMFTGALAQYALAQTLMGCVLCSAAVLTVLELIQIVQELFFLRATLWPALCSALPQLLWSLCWVPVVYAIFWRVFKRVGGDRLM